MDRNESPEEACARLRGHPLDYDDLPEKLQKDWDVCMAALEGGSMFGVPMLERIVPEAKTERLCLEAVRHDGMNLEFVPPEMATQEVCMAACEENGMALAFVPLGVMTKPMCEAAVAGCGAALEYALCFELSDEAYRAAVANDGEAIRWVPDRLLTPELCLEAMQTSQTRSVAEMGEIIAEILPEQFYENGFLKQDIRRAFETSEEGRVLAEEIDRLPVCSAPGA